MEPAGAIGGFGPDQGQPYFWIGGGAGPDRGPRGVHRASRENVDAFHAAALEAGATDNGGPGVRDTTTRTTTGRSCSTPMATTSKRSATGPPEPCATGSPS